MWGLRFGVRSAAGNAATGDISVTLVRRIALVDASPRNPISPSRHRLALVPAGPDLRSPRPARHRRRRRSGGSPAGSPSSVICRHHGRRARRGVRRRRTRPRGHRSRHRRQDRACCARGRGLRRAPRSGAGRGRCGSRRGSARRRRELPTHSTVSKPTSPRKKSRSWNASRRSRRSW